MRQAAEYIPKEACVHRRLYRVLARTFGIGVYNIATSGFCGIREKFGQEYVFEEYHWDCEQFASCKPVELLPETLPVDIEPIEHLPILVCTDCLQPMDPSVPMSKEGDRHLEPTECTGRYGKYRSNQALFDWLRKMELKYPRPDKG